MSASQAESASVTASTSTKAIKAPRRTAREKAEATRKAAAEKPARVKKPVKSKQLTEHTQAPTPEPAAVTEEQIAERAYFIWLSQGRPLGMDEQNWAQAVEDLTSDNIPADDE